MTSYLAKTGLALQVAIMSVAAIASGDDSLVAYFPFSGNADDMSGNNNHGTTYNVEFSVDRFGRDSHSYWFNSIDAFIEVQNSPSLILSESLSVSAWFRLDDLSREFQIMLRKGRPNAGTSDCSYAFYVRSYDELAFYFSDSTSVHQTTDLNLDDGVWYHAAVTFDSVAQEVKMYLNGVLVYDELESGLPVEYDYPIGLGKTNDPGQYFGGILDEIRVYNRALSEQEIDTIFHSVIFIDGFESGNLSAWD